MNSDYKRYAKTILNDFLKLKKGDALSVNVEESDFDIAKIFASEAIRITDVQVKIVVTEKGRPVDVIEFDPEIPGRTKTIGFALLRIAHSENSDEGKIIDGQILDNYPDKDDFVSIQKLNHLAEPVVLNRRLAIPYCVVPSSAVDFKDSVSDKMIYVDYRKKFLNGKDVEQLHFIGGNTDFTVDIPYYNLFNSNHVQLSNGRDFISSTDLEKISCTLDMNSMEGNLDAESVILGRKQKVCLKYKNGKLIDCSDSKQLKTLMSYDLNVVKPGFLEMADKSFDLFLGGSQLGNFKKEPEDENSIPDSFNTCVYSLKLHLPDNLSVYYSGFDGKEHEIVRKGFFLE